MKSAFMLVLGTAFACQASVLHFQLSPAGTDAAVGLSPSNEVPMVTNSSGSGDVISGGILFDTDTLLLQVDVGYGSAAGFTDLTGVPTAMHIHGPAAAGQNAGVLVDLSPYNFAAADPTKGGVIFGTFAFPTNAVSNLLAGLTYLNIHTALNPSGEIRGQLVPVTATNSPPLLVCPPDSTLQCGTEAMLTATVSDPDGDALTLVWSVNGAPVQTNTLPAQNPPVTTSVMLLADLPRGTNIVGITATDSATNTTSCSSTVTVVDTIPPVITRASANPSTLWPPNHRMVNVTVRASVTDACGPTTWRITRVTSNEPVNGTGDGDTAPDWQITGPHTLKLRAERSGRGHGRIYSIYLRAKDAAGNLSDPTLVTVTVPHSQSGR
jgi:CHRD domain